MRLKRLPINREDLLLLAIFAVYSASTVAWTLADKAPPVWDPADHMSAAYDYYRYAAHANFRGLATEFFIEPHYYAPLVHLITATVFLLAGASRLTGVVVNLLSLAVLLWSVRWIARTLYLGRKGDGARLAHGEAGEEESGERVFYPGVLAALLAASYHFSAWLLHDAFLDFPLTAIVAASFALLIKAGDFRDAKWAVYFGVSAGLGMLTKQTFAFFFVLPGLYAAYKVAIGRDYRAWANLALAAAAAAAIASIWYLPHLDDVIAIYNVNREGAINENEAPLFSLMSNLFYPHALVSAQLQVPLASLFLSGLIFSLFKRRRESLMLYLWLLSGIGMFTLVANKDVRYTVPATPAAAVLSVCWLAELHRMRSRARAEADAVKRPGSEGRRARPALLTGEAVMGAAAVWAMVSFFNSQWPAPGMGYYVDTPRFRWMVFARNYYALDHRPSGNDWSVPAIVETVAREGVEARARGNHPASGGSHAERPPTPRETISPLTREAAAEGASPRPTIGVSVNLPHLNPSTIGLYSRLLSPGRAGAPLVNVDYLVVESALDRLTSCDYLLVRTGLDRAEWVGPTERPVEEFIRNNPHRITRVANFPIPLEGAEAVLYRCGAPGPDR